MYSIWRRIHVSWLVAAAASGVVIGVISAQNVSPSLFPTPAWFWVAALLLGCAMIWRCMFMVAIALMAGCILGLWRGSLVQHELGVYQSLIGAQATVSGVVIEDADIDARDRLLLRLDQVKIDDHPVAGRIWVAAKTRLDIQRSDRVRLNGTLEEGFGTFSAAMYDPVVMSVERPEPGDVALRVRNWFASAVRLGVPEPGASLGVGYLVGQRRGLPQELDEALQVVGLTHIVVASGYNLTILVRLARRLFEKVSKYLSALSGGVMITSFIAITGMSPSMSRAGLVAGLSLLAWYYGRKFHPLVLLPFTAAATLLINPGFGWNDIGWQLSFAAFAGVMVLAPLSQAYFFGDKKPGMLRQLLGETVAAQLATLPMLVAAFGQFSNVAVVANLLVLPLVPLAMLLTFIAGVGSLLLPALAGIFSAPATLLLGYMTQAAMWLAALPWAQSELTITWGHAALAYIVLVAVCVYMWRKTNYDLRDANLVE